MADPPVAKRAKREGGEAVRVCIVGMGAWGQNGYQHLSVCKEARVVAVVEPDEGRRAEGLKLFAGSRPAGFASLADAVKEQHGGGAADAAIIAVPHVLQH
eukprot:gene34-459_t